MKTKLDEIIETYINGNISTARNEIANRAVDGFEIIMCTELFGIRQTIKVLKSLGIKDLYIINSFHDYDRENLDKAKEILLNNFY
mgnify:FL=1|jgi:hypothetical protein